MLKFLPWEFLIKQAARHYSVLDPLDLMARLRRFAQPSEVAEPLELLRAGIVFHARGLVNSKAIQQNLDWVWPYWVERQFDPEGASFIPRAFSFSHINLSHRNWTAVGMPGVPLYPLVDPRGLVTPLYDGWSLDFWIVTDSGRRLLPSKLDDESVTQRLDLEPDLEVTTESRFEDLELTVSARMGRSDTDENQPNLLTSVTALSDEPGWLAVAIRPYNPEGVQFIHKIVQQECLSILRVNDESTVSIDRVPDAVRMAHYADGDVYLDVPGEGSQSSIECSVGMATAMTLFRLEPNLPTSLQVRTSLEKDLEEARNPVQTNLSWEVSLKDNAQLSIPDERMQFLYDTAVRTVTLLSADDLVPGPYTYRRFWFRDACLMLHPLIVTGQVDRAERILDGFAERQKHNGYFQSQEGEWDSNGQVLWIAARFVQLTGRPLPGELDKALLDAIDWLDKKRIRKENHPEAGTSGLLPAGFSAEHLGPNDYYYWDDYWALAGLRAAAEMWKTAGREEDAGRAKALAKEFANSIGASLLTIPERRSKGGLPAAPGRRMDAGAIGSMVADYPLQIYPPGDDRVMKTTDYLMSECFIRGGFFQQMIHSGINAYLTLDLAQTLLRAGDPKFADPFRRVGELATPTGQWPEAIHPQTLGGCMGDGQHGWAAAEWIMMVRNCFVREEFDHLVIGSGILPEWLAPDTAISYGPTLTRWGPVSVSLEGNQLSIDASWRGNIPMLEISIPGFDSISSDGSHRCFELSPKL